ncbi:MAG: PspC domain-containing protein [Clostridia bacterium]|nr:PspC domain-containing protein [Clostridia bacterium]
MKKLYLGRDKKLCGLCAGLGNYLNLDPTLIRIVITFTSLATAIFPMIVIYLVMSLAMPQAPDDYVETNTGRILTRGCDKKISGVCSGYAEYFGVDVTVVRLIFALLLLFIGGGFWLYIISLLFMPTFHTPESFTR